MGLWRKGERLLAHTRLAAAAHSTGNAPDPDNSSDAESADTASSDGSSSAYDSDASDVFNLSCEPCGSFLTEQDKELKVAWLIGEQLRAHPLVPPHPGDAAAVADFVQVDSALKLPVAHCAFKGCKWSSSIKNAIEEHVLTDHRQQLLAAELQVWGDHFCYGSAWPLRRGAYKLNSLPFNKPLRKHFFGYYVQAIAEVERCSAQCSQPTQNESVDMSQTHDRTSRGIPIVGPSIDRRTFAHLREVYNSHSIRALICFVCAQRRTQTMHPNSNSKRRSLVIFPESCR